MKKQIQEVYKYVSYRRVLNDDFLARSSENLSYTMRAYARDLELSPGFLSQVLAGKKDLSAAKGRDVFSRIGFKATELEFIDNLIVFNSHSDQRQKLKAYDYIKKHSSMPKFDPGEDIDIVIKSPEHFIVYGVSRRLHSISKIKDLLEPIDINKRRVDQVIKDLIEAGTVKIEGDYLAPKDPEKMVRYDERTPLFCQLFSQFLGNAHGSILPMSKDNIGHALVLGFDSKNLEEAKNAHRHYLRELVALSEKSKSPEELLLLSDLFVALKKKS